MAGSMSRGVLLTYKSWRIAPACQNGIERK
jgi:hypothetical protein